jgi:hypothetical protein
MKSIAIVVTLAAVTAAGLFGQTVGSMIAPAPGSTPRIPRYILYRHFLGWVNSLHTAANAGTQPVDPYQFAQPFARAGLSHPNIDALVKEGLAMANDLGIEDAKIAAEVKALRAAATVAMKSGQPLPPVSPALHLLQLQRTGLLVQHMINLQRNLGPVAAASLDAYLDREFAPHVSLKALARPPSPISNRNAAN